MLSGHWIMCIGIICANETEKSWLSCLQMKSMILVILLTSRMLHKLECLKCDTARIEQ